MPLMAISAVVQVSIIRCGNECPYTLFPGYRSILDAMKTFASDSDGQSSVADIEVRW